MAADRTDLITAVNQALRGDRAAAHAIVDHIEDDPTACWIRACLHKIAYLDNSESDETNARHWYRRSGQFYESYPDPRTELAAIHAALTY